MFKKYFFAGFLCLFLVSCNCKKESVFSFIEHEHGIELLDSNKPVFYYQKDPKSFDNHEPFFNNYLHPVYNLDGEIITEEFPSDHTHHRGIFWSWHQVFVNGKFIGDQWIMDNIKNEVADIKTSIQDDRCNLEITVNWKSDSVGNSKPFILEKTKITVYPASENYRKIDFSISLQALTDNVELGGENGEKGYGGFCVRVKVPDDIEFVSTEGKVTPIVTQIEAGPYMDFSASYTPSGKSGVAILCHPNTPNYPAPWILRSETSMQNIVYPGSKPVLIPKEEPITLYYRLIIHKGDSEHIDLENLQDEYEACDPVK